jgi:hypothetical protein
VLLLQAIRDGQRRLAELTRAPSDEPVTAPGKADVASFLQSLSTAWMDGEVRATHRKQQGAARWWKTRADPFEHAWPIVEQWLMAEPTVTAKDLLERLAAAVPDAYAGTAQLRTLQRRVQRWRAEQAKTYQLRHLAVEQRQQQGAEGKTIET